MSSKVHIVGAGLVGSLLAILLKKAGINVSVFEKRNDPRKSRHFEGRSINLAISYRGIKSLERAGVLELVRPYFIPMYGRLMHAKDGQETIQPYGLKDQHINSVSRGNLNKILVEHAEAIGIDIFFGKKCDKVDTETASLHFTDGITNESDLVIGADGAFSVVRQAIQKQDRFNYSQHYIEYGYKELTIPARNGDFAIKPNYLHIWARGNFMLIALPNTDKSFTCTLFLPFEGKASFAEIDLNGGPQAFFEEEFPDVLELMPDLLEEYKKNPTSSMITIKCEPWYKDQAIVLGDAAHAIVPFYGQGMNCGFEDIQQFIDLAEEKSFRWKEILDSFSMRRKTETDAIAELALQNFREMRDLVNDPDFLKRKELEKAIQKQFPNDWTPQYSMVSFSDIPYSEALRLGKLQGQLLNKYMDKGNADYEDLIAEFNTLRKDG
jgi:kynurenine 3-monooxygenase